MSFTYKYARPAVTTTTVVIFPNPSDWKASTVLIGVRSKGKPDSAFGGWPSVPGGYLDPRIEVADISANYGGSDRSVVQEGETVEECALRELGEEIGLTHYTQEDLKLACVFSGPTIDPRCHVVNICYYITIDSETAGTLEAGDDLDEIYYVGLRTIFNPDYKLAFNHKDIAMSAINKWMADNSYAWKDN